MKVAVFEHPKKRSTRLAAYTRDYNTSWPGCCLHEIATLNGTIAKVLAAQQHRTWCMNGRKVPDATA